MFLGNGATTNVVTSGSLTIGGGGNGTMTYFEEYSTTLTFTGPTTENIPINLMMLNNKITFSIRYNGGANIPVANQYYTSSTALPSRFYNSTYLAGGSIFMIVYGANPSFVVCNVLIDNTGIIRIRYPETSGNFPTGGAINFTYSSFVYSV